MLGCRCLAVVGALLLIACSTPPAPKASTTIAFEGGRLTITGRLGKANPFEIRRAKVRVRVDGQLYSSGDVSCTSSGPSTIHCTLAPGLTLSVEAQSEGEGLLLTAKVSGTGHRVDGFELLATRDEGARVALADESPVLRYLHNGYQSWSFSGALQVPDGTTLPRANDVLTYPAPNGNVATDENIGLSSHSVVLDAGNGTAMLLGFVTTRHWQSAIGLESSGGVHRLTAFDGFTGDSLPLDGEVESESLLVQYATSPEAAMAAYGQALQARQGARSVPFGGQIGWFSWNRFFERIDESGALAQADATKSLVGAQGFDLIEIDDGWETAWGDWTHNSKFGDIAALASAVHAKGQRLGLWVAPFVVENELPIVAEHPHWWVKKLDGQPLVNTPALTPHHLRIVDLSNPEARAWAVGNLRALESAGVDFLKLDYLYEGAVDGLRSDPQATGVSALHDGLAAVFGGLQRASVNLCGVPWLHAALSPVSTMRTGTDVSLGGAPYGFVLVSTAARDMAARSFGPLSVRSDPDQFLLAPLTPDEQQTALILQAMAGETFALGDDLTQLSPDLRSAIAKAAGLRVTGGDLVARGIFETPGSELIGSPIQELLVAPNRVTSLPPAVITRGDALVAINWGDEAAAVDLHLAKGEKVTSLWGPPGSSGRVQLASHGSALFQLSR